MPTKLLTPVQYESVLSGLNDIRPLSLSDEGRMSLSIPVLNAEPVSNEKTARGKFLRCHNGSALISDSVSYSQYQLKQKFVVPAQLNISTFTFDPPVNYVIIYVDGLDPPKIIHWVQPVSYEVLASYEAVGTYSIRFSGTDITIQVPAAGPGPVEYELRGFY